MTTGNTEEKGGGKKPRKAAWYMIGISAVAVIGIAALAVIYSDEVRNLEEYGYAGAFVISFMAGATIIVYVPGVPVVFALGGILPYPFLVGIAAGLGEALGEFTGYLPGRGSRSFLQNQKPGRGQRVYARVEGWMKKRGYLTLFLASAVFNPFFDLFGATAGATRMTPWKFYLVCAAGKAVKGTYVAYLGMLALGPVLEFFGYKL
jgi:membrane protein YqaA with SNARE-associated domain